MLRPKRGRIRFNDGEAAYLRSCMRRFGWERRRDSGANCLWEETFSGVKLNDAVWWLVEQILQTRVSAEACIRHDPISISKARHSLAGISEATLALHADIIAWQQNNQSSSLPSEMEDSKLYSRISNYMDSQRNKRWKKLYVSYPFKLLAGYSVGKEGDPSQDGQMEHDIAVVDCFFSTLIAWFFSTDGSKAIQRSLDSDGTDYETYERLVDVRTLESYPVKFSPIGYLTLVWKCCFEIGATVMCLRCLSL